MISTIRDYIKARINAVDSDLKPISDAFGDNEVSEREADQGYKILINNSEFNRGANWFSDEFACTIEIYKTNGRNVDIIKDFDNLFEKVLKIRNEAINPKNIPQTFTDIIAAPVETEQVAGNDKMMMARTTLTVRYDFDCN